MIISRKSDDYEPVAWVGGHPLHVAALLAAAHVLALIGVAFLYAFRVDEVLEFLKFSSVAVLHGAIWRCITYAFIHNPMGLQSLFNFAIEIAFLVFFGLEVERFIGRRSFMLLYLVLVLAVPVTLTLHGLLGLSRDWVWVGSGTAHIGIFLAFATIYPSAEVFFRIQARWIAWGLLIALTVCCLAQRDLVFFTILWVEAFAAWLYMAWVRGVLSILRLPRVEFPGIRRRAPGAREEARLRKAAKTAPQPDPMDAIDPLLDKIAKGGMASLTQKERERLERAREELLRKGTKGT